MKPSPREMYLGSLSIREISFRWIGDEEKSFREIVTFLFLSYSWESELYRAEQRRDPSTRWIALITRDGSQSPPFDHL